MRLRPVQNMLALICVAATIFLSSCGAPPANQNAANNQGNAGNRTNANVATNTDGSMKTTAAVCTDTTDDGIEEALWILIEGDATLKPSIPFINIDSKQCIVKLHGSVDTWAKFKNLYNKVYNTSGVLKVDITRFSIGPNPTTSTAVTCPSGFKPCRQVCIPEEDECTGPGSGGETKDTMSNSNTNANTSPTP